LEKIKFNQYNLLLYEIIIYLRVLVQKINYVLKINDYYLNKSKTLSFNFNLINIFLNINYCFVFNIKTVVSRHYQNYES